MMADDRVIATLRLPVEVRDFVRISNAITKAFPDAVLDESGGGVAVWAHPQREA